MNDDIVHGLVDQWSSICSEDMRKATLALLDDKRVDLIRRAAGDEEIALDALGLTSEGMRRQYAARAKSTRALIVHIEQAMRLVSEAPMPER